MPPAMADADMPSAMADARQTSTLSMARYVAAWSRVVQQPRAILVQPGVAKNKRFVRQLFGTCRRRTPRGWIESEGGVGKVLGETRLWEPSDRYGGSMFAVGMLRKVVENKPVQPPRVILVQRGVATNIWFVLFEPQDVGAVAAPKIEHSDSERRSLSDGLQDSPNHANGRLYRQKTKMSGRPSPSDVGRFQEPGARGFQN